MQLNNLKLELIKKIVEARLSKAELKEVTAKAEELIKRRDCKPNRKPNKTKS